MGDPRRATRHYEITEPYLRFWLAVLYADAQLVEAGQGRAVLRRSNTAWQGTLVGPSRRRPEPTAHAWWPRAILPDDLIVGSWLTSSRPPCEVDVLGSKAPAPPRLGYRHLEALRRKLPHVPHPLDDPWLALRGRTDVDPGTTGLPRSLGLRRRRRHSLM